MASELECEHKHWTYSIWISKKCHSSPSVMIVGVGGLGLMATQLAKAIMELTDKLGADAVMLIKRGKLICNFLDEEQGYVGKTLRWLAEIKFSFDANESIQAKQLISG